MVDIQTISIVVAAIGVFIAAINSVITSRQSNQQRQQELETQKVQLFMQLNDRRTSREFWQAFGRMEFQYEWEDYEDWRNKYGLGSEEWVDFLMVGSFIEGVGVLVQRGIIDEGLVYDLMGINIKRFWEKYEEIIFNQRKEIVPNVMDHAELLYNRIKKYEQQQQ